MRTAVIGNANTLEGFGLGQYIDLFDRVVRINFGYMPESLSVDRGFKTDVLYHCSSFKRRFKDKSLPDVPVIRHLDHKLRVNLMPEFFNNQLTAGILAAIEFSKEMRDGDELFIGAISFFTEPYTEKYNNQKTDVLESARGRVLQNIHGFVHSSAADRAAFEKYVLTKSGILLDPWLSNEYPTYKTK